MTYSKTAWSDRAVQTPNSYTKSNETTNSVTLVQNPGTITQAGTPINATNLNKLEQGVFDAHNMLAGKQGVTDLNNSLTTGAYQFTPTTLNAPYSGRYGVVFCTVSLGDTHDNATNWIWQLAYNTSDLGMKMRSKVNSSAWSAWVDVWTSGTISPVSKNGDTITGALNVRVAGNNPARPTGTWASVVDNTFDVASNHGLAVATRWGNSTSTIFEAASYWSGSAEVYTPVFTVKGDKTIAYNGTTMPQIRDNGGILEYLSGGVWKKVAGYGSTRFKGRSTTRSASYVTALSLTGMGSLRVLALGVGYFDDGSTIAASHATVEITVDGTVYASPTVAGQPNGNYSLYMNSQGNVSGYSSTIPFYECDIKFENSLVVKLKAADGASTVLDTYMDYVYEIV